MKVFIDSNIFIHFLTTSDESQTAYSILTRISEQHSPVTSITVVEEVIFVIIRENLRAKGINNKFKLKETIVTAGYKEFEGFIFNFFELLDTLDCVIIEGNVLPDELFSFMEKYHLLPQDALITALCRQNNIPAIATFDTDFSRVDFLQKISD